MPLHATTLLPRAALLAAVVALTDGAGFAQAPAPAKGAAAKIALPEPLYEGAKPTITESTAGTTYATKDRMALLDLSSRSMRAYDPAHLFDEPPSGCPTRDFHYRYSIMLVRGEATITPNGTVVLTSGELYVASTIVDDPIARESNNIPAFFPLIRTSAVQAGSVSTEYVVRTYGETVQVSFRSSSGGTADPNAGVWVMTGEDVARPCQDVRRAHSALATSVVTGDVAGTRLTIEPINGGEDARFALLRTWAHDFGVKD